MRFSFGMRLFQSIDKRLECHIFIPRNGILSFQVEASPIMRAKELVPILAEIYGVPFDTAFMIDRSLSEAGLRTKGKGRRLPEMTRREAIIFLIACMVTLRATKAGQEVQPWLSADGWVNDEIESGDCPSQDHSAMGLEPPQELIEEYRPGIRNEYMREVARRLDYQPYDDDDLPTRINMIDCLLAVCDVLEAHHLTGEDFKFEISVSHGWAAVSVNERFSGGYSEIRFQTAAGADNPVSYETQINKSAVVYGDALLALAVRTKSEEGRDQKHDERNKHQDQRTEPH